MLVRMPDPQLEMQLSELAAVMGSPLGGVQKSAVVPQNPQPLQQALRGHGLREARSVPLGGFSVPSFRGPHVNLLIWYRERGIAGANTNKSVREEMVAISPAPGGPFIVFDQLLDGGVILLRDLPALGDGREQMRYT